MAGIQIRAYRPETSTHLPTGSGVASLPLSLLPHPPRRAPPALPSWPLPQALEALSKLRKEKASDVKEMRLKLENLKTNKDIAQVGGFQWRRRG